MNAIIVKIQKLLALAGNNPNEHERNEAMEMALSMLADHNLDLAEVNGKNLSDKPDTHLERGINLEVWSRHILLAVTKLYFTSLLIRKEGAKTNPIIIGTKENIQVTLEIFKWLAESVKKEGNRLYSDHSLRRSFRLGAAKVILHRAMDLLREERAKGETNVTGTSLMVLRNGLERANEDYIGTLNVGVVKQRASNVNATAYANGAAYGNQMSLKRQIAGAGG